MKRLAVLVCVAAGLLVVWWWDAGRLARDPDHQCASYSAALFAAQDAVRSRLRAPATADFPLLGATEGVTRLDGCTFRVNSYVDAQNGFGALIRTAFTATVRYDRERRSWVAVGIDLAE